jgi:hypothetical protein
MVKRHDDHDDAAKQVDRLNALAMLNRLNGHSLKLATIGATRVLTVLHFGSDFLACMP